MVVNDFVMEQLRTTIATRNELLGTLDMLIGRARTDKSETKKQIDAMWKEVKALNKYIFALANHVGHRWDDADKKYSD